MALSAAQLEGGGGTGREAGLLVQQDGVHQVGELGGGGDGHDLAGGGALPGPARPAAHHEVYEVGGVGQLPLGEGRAATLQDQLLHRVLALEGLPQGHQLIPVKYKLVLNLKRIIQCFEFRSGSESALK